MNGALTGLRVLDLSESIAGQFCARMLADQGADVTLVEPPAGSSMRNTPPFDNDGQSLLFFHLNIGKSSCLSGAEPSDADVVVIGLGHEAAQLRALHPRAILAEVSPFGRDGPLKEWHGSEMVYQALAGAMRQNGTHPQAPLYGCGERASYAAGVATYISVIAALIARQRTGVAQSVSIDIAETASATANPALTQFFYNGMVEPRGARRLPFGRALCRDGWVTYWIHNHLYGAVCDALALPELSRDERFASARARQENWPELVELIQAHVADWSADDMLARLQARKVAAARAYRLTDLWAGCPHLEQRSYWESVGGRPVLGPQFRMSRTPRRLRGPPPAIGASQAAAPSPPWVAGTEPFRNLSHGPLTGLRVVEMTTAWAGPMAGRILAFLGAEVIHVESATRLDSWRQYDQVFSPYRYPSDGAGERRWNRNALFNSANTNKLSLSLDLKKPGGLPALQRLLAKSDVLMTNFTPGMLARLDLNEAALRALRPDMVMAEMPAFGNAGPLSHGTALGPTMEMASGMGGMIGYPGGPPTATGPTYLDPIGALHGAAGILTALLHRLRTGEGQSVEVPQVEAAMQFIGEHLLHAIATGVNPEPQGNHTAFHAPHDAFPAAGEDSWLAVAVTSQAAWHALCGVIGQPELATDPRFATLKARLANQDALFEPIAAWTRTRDKQEGADILQAAGIPAAPVQDARDCARSRYLAARGYFTELEHRDVGQMMHEGLPFHLSVTPGGQYRASPCLGQHTAALLSEVAGLSAAEIAELERAGATAAVPA
jgi:crotonobetainyl-CoA:carnitine CoA-transferase CaiB-like acyl-CoA transferase